tara:strand:- start:208 stop:720 length:513 start_codon:yes stop_codon:yes gene_type:complete
MKKLLSLLLLILIGCSSPEPINIETMLIERNDVYYTKDTNQPYSGPVFTLYENGKLSSEGTLKNGKIDGTNKFYLKEEGTYKNYNYSLDNKLDGPFKYYDTVGQIFEEGTLKNGKLNGLLKSYDPNGQLQEEETYKDDKPDGPYKWYNDNGQLEEEGTYKDGIIIDSKEY